MKTYISADLVHIALIVSLLRLFPELYNPSWNREPLVREVFLGASSAYTQTNFHNIHNRLDDYVNFKNVDNFISRSLFLHELGAYTRSSYRNEVCSLRNNVIAYIVNSQHQTLPLRTNNSSSSSEEGTNNNSDRSTVEESLLETPSTSSDLTQEDMDLIEILWKQDIDLGIAREVFDGTWTSNQELQKPAETIVKKELENVKNESQELPQEPMVVSDPWEGLHYTIDSETGEHIIHNPPARNETSSSIQLPPEALQNICLQDALQLFEGDMYQILPPAQPSPLCSTRATEPNEFLLADSKLLLEQLKELEQLTLEARNETEVSGSMDAEWSAPPIPPVSNAVPASQTSHSFLYESEPMNVSDSSLQASNSLDDVLLCNTTLPSVNQSINYSSSISDFQMQTVDDRQFLEYLEMLSNGSYPDVGTIDNLTSENVNDFFGTNLTNGISDYLSQLLTDEELDLMDFTTLPEGSETNVVKDDDKVVSDDSAVSSMSSESFNSDPDWNDSDLSRSGDGDSDYKNDSPPSHTRRSKKHRDKKSEPSSKTAILPISSSNFSDISVDSTTTENSVGRRFSSDQARPESSETFYHNHTYHLQPSDDKSSFPKKVERDKKALQSSSYTHTSRDERRAKSLNIPFSNSVIINVPIEEFNELLSKYDLTEAQLTLIRDIRRRGKNKVAAQNCRKRKLNQIFGLHLELNELQEQKLDMEEENQEMLSHHQLMKEKYDRLYNFVFQSPDPPDPHGFSSQLTKREDERAVIHTGANSTSQDSCKEFKSGARTKRKQEKK